MVDECNRNYMSYQIWAKKWYSWKFFTVGKYCDKESQWTIHHNRTWHTLQIRTQSWFEYDCCGFMKYYHKFCCLLCPKYLAFEIDWTPTCGPQTKLWQISVIPTNFCSTTLPYIHFSLFLYVYILYTICPFKDRANLI